MLSEAQIRSICYSMKPGQVCDFHREDFCNAFRWGWPTIYNTPIEAFLSGMIGSSWGTFRVRETERGDYRVSRHKESDRRYYVDPDRAHLFVRMLDGTLEHIDSIAERKARED